MATSPDQDTALRLLVTEIIKRCPKKREQIAEELSSRLGQHITVHILNSYTSAVNRSSRFPAAWLEAFSEIVGDDRLEKYVISKRNRDVLEFGEAAANVLTETVRKGLRFIARRKPRKGKRVSKHGSA
ncbi:MAG: hypothetical protein LAO20_10345 [Acidobacteriia bacterium]|nr:hypothetical protein [Terriglobia bacterium]